MERGREEKGEKGGGKRASERARARDGEVKSERLRGREVERWRGGERGRGGEGGREMERKGREPRNKLSLRNVEMPGSQDLHVCLQNLLKALREKG